MRPRRIRRATPGQEWPCGRTAADWLKAYLRGRHVHCVGHARDRYGRPLAICYVGGENLNERIVREGWALDCRRYSTDYLKAEANAKRPAPASGAASSPRPGSGAPNVADVSAARTA
jgi:endonuclease YncB( thermonuclease family)